MRSKFMIWVKCQENLLGFNLLGLLETQMFCCKTQISTFQMEIDMSVENITQYFREQFLSINFAFLAQKKNKEAIIF